MKWTEQQENAITARDSSVIVSAAAGSGKTAVLTERLVQLMADPASGVHADRMIVVTFTNDAASELKKRLDAKMRKLINDDPGNAHLIKQQTLLQNAKISTINSFCFELIRDNISDQGITPGFSILDETDDKVIRSQAMDDLFNYYSKNEYEKISFMYDRFCINSDKELSRIIELTDKFLDSAAMRDKWLDDAVREYSLPFRETSYFSNIQKTLIHDLTRAKKLSDSYCSLISPLFLDDRSCEDYAKWLAQAEKELAKITDTIKAISEGELPSAADIAALCQFDRIATIKKKTPRNPTVHEILKSNRKLYIAVFRNALNSITVPEDDMAESAEVLAVLAEMMKKYHEFIWERKCSRNAVSFADGERLALELLADTDADGRIIPSEAARRLSEHYDLIMIDEYQDSNNKQDMIFKLISKNFRYDSDGTPMYGTNVFLVGDVKQSIYGFRLANPQNFITTLRHSEIYSKESSAPNKSIFLNQNFRSSPEVIGFVNFIFKNIMSENCGDISYDENEMLYFGASQYAGSDAGRLTSITILDKDSSSVQHTVSLIEKMLRTGAEVVQNDGTKRKCRPSDFCILLRGNKNINKYSEMLENLGIPAKGKEESGYLRSREISILLDLLRIINNPLLDIPMTAVMTSPMYMFDIREIAAIRSLDREKDLFSLLKGLVSGEYPDTADETLIARCREFLDSLDRFRLASVTMTLGELIASIYDTTDFISVMQLSSGGEKKRANLRALVMLAQGHESSVAYEGSGGLGSFLRHIDRVLENGDYEQQRSSAAAGDYVSVMTMHKSKGLEFPFVFLPDMNDTFKKDSDPVMCSDDGRIGFTLYDPKLVRKYNTFQQRSLCSEKAMASRSEEMRLLYVAMTRAKQKLFIDLRLTDKYKKSLCEKINDCIISGSDISSMTENASCFADWIWACLMKHSAMEEIAEKLGLASPEFGLPVPSCEAELFKWDIVSEKTETEEAEISADEPAAPDEEICRKLREMISFSYDKTLSEMPAKLSVTQITKKLGSGKENFDLHLRRPRFAAGQEKLTGAERGTAIHTFFQYCDFDEAADSPVDEIQRVCDHGFISQPEADSISVTNTAAFFASDLYKRIKASPEVWREKKFTAAVAQLDVTGELAEKLKKSNGMIKGIIDLMFSEDDGEIVIVDYKSDRGASEAALRQRYTAQLTLYRSAVELTMGRKVKEGLLYSFELKKTIKIF